MADESTYVIRLASWLGSALGDSTSLFADFSTESLGIELPPAVLSAGPVQAAARSAEIAAVKVREASGELGTVAATQDELQILAGFLELGAALAEFSAALHSLLSDVENAVSAMPNGPEKTKATEFAGKLAKKITDYAIASAITSRTPQFAFALKLAGLLDWQYTPEGATSVERPYVRKELRLDRIKDLISDPGKHFRDSLRWGENDFDPTGFFKVVRDFFPEEFEMELGVQAGDPFLKACMLIRRDRSQMPPGLLLALEGSYGVDIEKRRNVSDEWAVGVSSNLRMTGGIVGRLRPPLAFQFQPVPASAEITGEFRGFVERAETARPFDIVGGTGLLAISAENVNAGLGMRANWNAVQGSASFDPLLFAAIEGLTLKIGAGDADSFIGALLAAAEIEGEFDLGLEWQATTGLRVTASGGIEIALPIHRQLGPIELQTIYFSLRIKNDGTMSTEISAAIAGKLGPLSASVDRIGALLDVKFANANQGGMGPFDLDLGFKPPNGVGLSINAGVVAGGGYLNIDTERGEYSGAIELTFSGFLSLKAIGLINTKMPDGSSGFSLLIIITAEFGTGLQLGFGFTLLAVGGILGLNRTMRMEQLMEGVRTNAVESVMFPKDVVANAPRIISDLRNFFPPENGTFLIGPMAKLGWGTPPLITVSLGVIIEIPPGNIAILGVLKVALPTDETALIKLQVNFAGAMEFDKKRLYFFAALFDSRVVFLTIEGEMGLLVAWGDDGNFVVSVGGFHPSFSPPPLPFPSPRRVAISLIDTSVARIRVEGYFAVTSNTAQFGARVEMFFGFSSLNISGHLAFDALFQFSPFSFIITISASFSLKVFGAGLFSVRISGSLRGPAPWRAAGTGSISLLFFDISADFDVTWGESDNTQLEPIKVLPLLKGELEKRENWRALLPPNNNLLVTLRKLPEEDSLVLHPVGALRISQRAIPLELTLDKVGNRKPEDVKKVAVSVQGALDRKGDTMEKFAPAQYQNFTDAEKLSRPAFVSEKGGLEITAKDNKDMASAKMVKRIVRYEEIIIDAQLPKVVLLFADFLVTLFTFFLGNGAIAKNELSKASRKKLDPRETKIAVSDEAYTVAFQSNNKAYGATTAFHSEASAREFLASEAARDPELGATLHVIPSYERAA